jgi:methyl-accepting chemotaxis protein
MRYRDDGSGYMWIDDTDYNLVMHPIQPENEGVNRYNLEDQNGVMIIQVIMEAAQNGGGYNEFYFTKADGVTVAPKMAYSELFEPWGWVVTTGNYIDDMQAEMGEIEDDLTTIFAGSMIVNVVEAVIPAHRLLYCPDDRQGHQQGQDRPRDGCRGKSSDSGRRKDFEPAG